MLGNSLAHNQKGEFVMMLMVTFTLFAVALALPGLIGELLGVTGDNAAESHGSSVPSYTPPAPLSHWMHPSS